MLAHLIVRATVPNPDDRDAFDTWYAEDHMAAVIATFRPLRCWRLWSIVDAAVHYACYEFESLDHLSAMMETAAFANLVADFTGTWGGRVTRERDVVLACQWHERDGAPRVPPPSTRLIHDEDGTR